MISPSQGRYLYREKDKHRMNEHSDIHVSSGFEPTIPAFGQAKTVHSLDSAATVIGKSKHALRNYN
jgi:hypothetical protein